MDETEHWRLRLLELQDALDVRQVVMAEAMNIDASYYSRLRYEPGKKGRKNLGLDTLRSLCKAFKLRADWFDLPLGTELPGPWGHGNHAFKPPPRQSAHLASEADSREPSRPAIAWPFKDVAYQRLIALQKALGPKHAGEAMRDLDSLLDVAVTRWEQRVTQLSKRAS